MRAIARVAFAACAVACASRPSGIATSEPTRIEHRADLAGVPHVAAGTPFEVVTIDALGTTVTTKSAAFRARLTDDLADDRGRILVRSGALVRGKVTRTSAEDSPPALVLDIESVETVRGEAPLEATLRSADHHVVFPDESGEIVIPPGSRLRFVLTRPIVLAAQSP